jgi:ATP-dependent DNA helicase RecG
MDQTALTSLLDQLIAHWEDEVVEFKRGKDSYSASDLGKYLSALANEANLRGKDRAWIVFGVDDKTRKVVGTTYKENPEQLQATKKQVLDGTGSITFRNIHEMLHPDGRVILFEVPAAPRGMPITSNGHAYGRAGRAWSRCRRTSSTISAIRPSQPTGRRKWSRRRRSTISIP